jgi:ABC-type multidrug transport system fused ATPase/permease subunit
MATALALAARRVASSAPSAALRMAWAAAEAASDGAGTATAALVLPGFLDPLWQRVMAWAGPAGVWPPRRKGVPLYVGMWCGVIATIFFGFIRKGHNTKESEWEKARKRRYIQASLENMLEFEDARLAEEAEAKAKAGSKDGVEAKPTKQDTDSSSDEEDKAKKKAPKKKEAADAKKIFSLVYDEVEDGPVTRIGIDGSSEWYQRALVMLKARLEHELVEATDNTKYARGLLPPPPEGMPDKVEDWKDGEKLMDKVKLAHDQVGKCFGRKFLDRAKVKEAQRICTTLVKARKAAVLRIFKLFLPHAPKWMAGTGLLMFTETMWGFLFGELVSTAQLAYDITDNTMRRALIQSLKVFIWFCFNWPLDNLGDTFVDDVEAMLQLDLRNAVMGSIMSQDREYFDNHQAGVLQERLNKDTEDLAKTIIQQPKNMISAITRITVKVYVLYRLSPQLFWLGISIPVPACVILNTLGWRLVRKSHKKISKVNDQAAAQTSELLREINTVRQFSMEREEQRRYRMVATWRQQLERAMSTTRMMTFGTMWAFFVFSRIFNTYWGINFVVLGELSPANLILAVYQFDGIVWGARQIVDLFPALAQLMQPLGRVASLLDSVPVIEPHPERPVEKLKPDKFKGHFVFKDVDFTYPSERQKQVLFKLSFEVLPKTKVAFVGKAGCGKSTSVTLIQRFYDVLAGQITLDGVALQEYDVHNLRRHIGVVAQENVLFSTSIVNNIIYGMGQGHLPQPTEADIWAACDAANATEFIKTFPNGLHTFVGEKGVKLSGGQKQRIAIARAMIRHPTILLLDEATSALDSVNEKEVQKALDVMLKQHDGVAICIAHRLTTIKNCDKIIVMDQGKKVEEGSHLELLSIPVVKEAEDNKKKEETEEEDGDAEDTSSVAAAADGTAEETGDKSEKDGKKDEKEAEEEGAAGQLPSATKIVSGYYHNMWDTQMGEESFGSAEDMTEEQLDGKLSFLRTETTRLVDEKAKRAQKKNDDASATADDTAAAGAAAIDN